MVPCFSPFADSSRKRDPGVVLLRVLCKGGGGREGGQDCLGCWLQTPLAYGAPISCLHILAVVAQV